jgi:hypothetical protein
MNVKMKITSITGRFYLLFVKCVLGLKVITKLPNIVQKHLFRHTCMYKLFIQNDILTNLLLNIYIFKKPVIYLLSFMTFKPKTHLINNK